MSEPKQIIPWFNTHTLAEQVLTSLENNEVDRLEQAGETSLPDRVWTDTMSVQLDQATSLAPSLEGLCGQYVDSDLSDPADEALRKELEYLADMVIQEMPENERDAVLQQIRRKWEG